MRNIKRRNLSFLLRLFLPLSQPIIASLCLEAFDTHLKQIIRFRLPRNLLPQLHRNRRRARRCLFRGCDRSFGVVSRIHRGFPDIPLRGPCRVERSDRSRSRYSYLCNRPIALSRTVHISRRPLEESRISY